MNFHCPKVIGNKLTHLPVVYTKGAYPDNEDDALEPKAFNKNKKRKKSPKFIEIKREYTKQDNSENSVFQATFNGGGQIKVLPCLELSIKRWEDYLVLVIICIS